MQTNDILNACFEFFGGIILFLNVRQLYRDKKIAGVHWAPVCFYASWGLFNLWYYPSLNQMFSFYAGILVFVANLAWLILLFKYTYFGEKK